MLILINYINKIISCRSFRCFIIKSSFHERYGLTGGVVSAVDLVKGIGLCAGLEAPEIPNATGNYDTNYAGKAQAAIDILKRHDFVYIHVEAPDECGHHFDAEKKIYSIEQIDKQILGPVLRYLENQDFSILLLPDHPTPVSVGRHIGDPVPFALYSNVRTLEPHGESYSEKACHTGFTTEGFRLLDLMIR